MFVCYPTLPVSFGRSLPNMVEGWMVTLEVLEKLIFKRSRSLHSWHVKFG